MLSGQFGGWHLERGRMNRSPICSALSRHAAEFQKFRRNKSILNLSSSVKEIYTQSLHQYFQLTVQIVNLQ